MGSALATLILVVSEVMLSRKKNPKAEVKLLFRTISFLAMTYLAFHLIPNVALEGLMVLAAILFYLASAVEYFRDRKGRTKCRKL